MIIHKTIQLPISFQLHFIIARHNYHLHFLAQTWGEKVNYWKTGK